MIIRILTVLLIFSLLEEGNAQNAICNEWSLQERRELARNWKAELAESGLVVVMESNRRKMDYLQSQLEGNQELSKKRKVKITEDLEKLRTETLKKAEKTIEGFRKNFDFSEVFFIWDYNIRAILNQADTAVLLTDDLDYLDLSPFQSSDEIFFLIRGRADRNSGRSGMQGFLIRNRALNPLCAPFPYFLSRNENNFFNVIFSIFKPDLYGEREMSQVAERFNSRLHAF